MSKTEQNKIRNIGLISMGYHRTGADELEAAILRLVASQRPKWLLDRGDCWCYACNIRYCNKDH
jgi:hypothetical protein